MIGVAAIVPNNAMADSLMDDISFFVEDNTEANHIRRKGDPLNTTRTECR